MLFRLTILFLLTAGCSLLSFAQETTTAEQQLENLTDADQSETEDDSYLQQLEQLRKTPLNLNTADENDLKELKILSGLQIAAFLSYRNLLGKLVSLYELQAIPGWDVQTIRKLLPFITVTEPVNIKEELRARFRKGESSLLLRYSQVLERSKGFDASAPGTKYSGSPQKLLFRYRYQYKNLLQYGLTGDKDAGEQFFKGAQNKGFDFYSFHFFARKIGVIQSLAIGDFTVNMGQGLIQWQSLGFRKNADVLGLKRQSPVLRPYSSAGEFNFHRGAGITFQKKRVEATLFGSHRKLSANFVTDTLSNEDYISSFLNSGYHRTESEIADRNRLSQFAFGGNIKYKTGNWHAGFNAITFRFSSPVLKRPEPYNLYAISGKNWSNYSLDYSYTYRNLHFFGEASADKNFNKAFINGLLISVDPRVDISLLHRSISEKYQSINGNAFTENTYPVNENGFFAGISIRPADTWRIDAYADIYKFPWLKYLVDAPGRGKDFLVQLTYTPNKQTEIYTRYRNENKQVNNTAGATATNPVVFIPKQNWRTQISFRINNSLTIRNRTELVWYDKKGEHEEKGFLVLADILYKPVLKPFSGNLRLQYFETDEYNSRIYAYENDVLFYYAIPVFYNKGFRYYINISADLTPKLSVWVKWSQSLYRDINSIGSGPDEIPGSARSELRIQARLSF